jgi:hypothetical protein
MIRHHHRITTAIALTLALAASAAPVALGDPQPLAQAESAIASHTPASPVSCGDVCSGHGYGFVGVTRTTASPVSCGDVCSGHGYGPVNTPATIVRVVAPGGGFDWGDAAIGAGAALVLVGIGLAGTRAAPNSRRRHVRQQRATASS